MVTVTDAPRAESPLMRTLLLPFCPATTARSTRLEASYAATASLDVVAVTLTMLPVWSAYHLYIQYDAVGRLLYSRPLSVPASYQKARSASRTPSRSNWAM